MSRRVTDIWIPFQLRVYLLLVGTGRRQFPCDTEALHRAFEEVRKKNPELFPEFKRPVVLSNYPYSHDLASAFFFLMNARNVYQDAPWFEHYFLVEEEIEPILRYLRARNSAEVEALLKLGPAFAKHLDRFGKERR